MSRELPPVDPDRYLTLREGPEVEIRVKGSRFLGQAFPAEDPSSAERLLATVRKRFHDATHHCSAWRCGLPEEPRERFDDDGEPSGSAGAPILSLLRGEGLVDVFCVVTRYYGGTKLGTGGLVRAYGDAAREAVAAAPKAWIERLASLRVTLPYEVLGAVEATLAREGAHLRGVERAFEPEPLVEIQVLRSQATRLADLLVEATAGRARVSRE